MLQNLFLSKEKINSDINDDIDILRLIRSQNVGVKTFFNLINLFGSATIAIDNIKDFSLKGGRKKPIDICSKFEAEKEIELLHKNNAKLLTYKDSKYSKLLLAISDPPPVISYKGNIELLSQLKTIAIVGTRNASTNGRMFAAKISLELLKNDFILVSGLAKGIDSTIHEVDTSKTIGVIAGGIDHIYPPENFKLFKEMEENGLIIAELSIGSKPLAINFPQRNRIISGLSIATIVIEASLKSGSLITARFALEQNREIFAVPGFPLDPRCAGTNKLIKEGAHMVETIDDILENLPQNNSIKEHNINELKLSSYNIEYRNINMNYDITDKMRNEIKILLSSVPVDIDLLILQTKFPISVVTTIILELELAGKIQRIGGNKVVLLYE